MKIRIQNLQKSYGTSMVLDIQELLLPKGRITAIVGPNGAGKSTLLNLIGGLIERDRGDIFYNGKETPPLREMTMVFQEPYLISASVRANIGWPMKLRKMAKPDIQNRIQELTRMLKLESILDKKSWQLSLGEAQKAALARALSFGPRLLLLDEPSASMDPYMTNEIEKILIEMNRKEGTTILIVTHNLAQARRIAGHVVLLNRGQVVESGDAKAFFEHPVQIQTKKFIEGELLI